MWKVKESKKMELILSDQTGKVVGKVKDYTLFNAKCERVGKVNPKLTLDTLIKSLFLRTQSYII